MCARARARMCVCVHMYVRVCVCIFSDPEFKEMTLYVDVHAELEIKWAYQKACMRWARASHV